MKACVIIPTYNESAQIARLISSIRRQSLDVVVIDDGSNDSTHEIAEKNGASVIRNGHNKGKGASLKEGFSFALKNDFDAVITMDGDGQHLPQDIPDFLRRARETEGGIIIGNRMHKPRNMPLERLCTNKIMSWAISLITKQDIPDSQCGFRLIKREVLETVKLKTSKFETESEILLKASRLGFKIESVPVTTVYNGEKSKIRPLKDTLRFLRFLAKSYEL